MSRTIFLDSVGEEAGDVYKIVLDAQKKGLQALKPGVSAKQVDAFVRQFIMEAGFGEEFGHNTGHGVGIEVHEAPVIGPKSDEILKEGMVITIEPGIYRPGSFGIRIEDLVLITKDGAKRLSKSSKRLKKI